MGWPRVRQQAVWLWVAEGLWQAQRLALLGYLGVALSQQRTAGPALWAWGWAAWSASRLNPGSWWPSKRMAATRRP